MGHGGIHVVCSWSVQQIGCFAIIKDYFLLGKHSLAQYKLLENSLPTLLRFRQSNVVTFIIKETDLIRLPTSYQ